MRVVYLNVWLGKRTEEVVSFVERYLPTTNIFCFQEMTPELAQIMTSRFPTWRGCYTKRVKDSLGEHGNMMMVKAGTEVGRMGGISMEAAIPGGYPTVVQLMKVKQAGGQHVLIGNVQGTNTIGDDTKEQTKDRESHFGSITRWLAEAKCPHMLVGGDWNARREIPVLQELEHHLGMKNLMNELGVRANRGSVHRQRVEQEGWPYLPDGDYVYGGGYSSIVVGSEPLLTASDHLPQIIDVTW